MLSVLLPREAGNDFRGRKAGLWILAVVLLLFAVMSANSIFNGHYVATKADGLPLDSFSTAATQVIIKFYAMWGATQLIIVTFGTIALVRYRALVPLTFLLLLVEQVFWRAVHHALPISRQGASGGSWFIYVLLAATLTGFVLSVWKRSAKD